MESAKGTEVSCQPMSSTMKRIMSGRGSVDEGVETAAPAVNDKAAGAISAMVRFFITMRGRIGC